MVAQLEDFRVGHGVEDLQALLPAGKHPGMGKGIKVAGDVGLRQAAGLDEVGNAPLTVLERMNQLEPAGLAQDAKAAGDELERMIGEDKAR
jgi:hypothetical protein